MYASNCCGTIYFCTIYKCISGTECPGRVIGGDKSQPDNIIRKAWNDRTVWSKGLQMSFNNFSDFWDEWRDLWGVYSPYDDNTWTIPPGTMPFYGDHNYTGHLGESYDIEYLNFSGQTCDEHKVMFNIN